MAKSTILDINGQPFTLDDLAEPQTEANAKLAMLHRHYGEHPSSGLTPAKLAGILREAEQGNLIAQCELAEDMEEKDAHIQSELGKRRLAWQGPDWNIVPPPNPSAAEKRDAEMIEELLRSATWLDSATFDAADAILKGFSAQELTWDYADKTHTITGAEWRDPSWFQPHPDKRNQLMLRDGSYTGEAPRNFGWIIHRAKSKSGYLARTGLVRVLAWPFLFKNYSVRDLAEFLEIYGLPLRLGKYPEGASEKEKLTLLRAVMSIGHNAGGIIPRGMEIEFQKAAEGASDPFMAMITWCEKSQSKAILGGTLTSQADGASSTNALGNVHNEVRTEIRDADLKALENTYTRDIVYPLYVLNGKSYQSPRRIPRFEFDLEEPADLAAFVQPLEGLVRAGVQVPVGWVHEKTKIPQPVGDEPVLKLPDQAPPAPGVVPNKAQLAALKAQEQQRDVVDDYVDQMHQAGNAATTAIIDQIRALVDEADTLEDLRDAILALKIPVDDLAGVMAQALEAAALAGRHEQLEDVG
jgi:phage gp29-like protein